MTENQSTIEKLCMNFLVHAEVKDTKEVNECSICDGKKYDCEKYTESLKDENGKSTLYFPIDENI